MEVSAVNIDGSRGTTENAQGQWIPLMEYAMKKSVSLSTLRRYIKAGKVRFKIENGKYLLLDSDRAAPVATVKVEEPSKLGFQLKALENNLRKAQEEISELKMLIALYEEKIPSRRDT